MQLPNSTFLLLALLPLACGSYRQPSSGNAVVDLERTVEAIVADWKSCFVTSTKTSSGTTTTPHPPACDAMHADLMAAYMATYTATRDASSSKTATCFAMMSILSSPFLPLVTNQAFVTCTAIINTLDDKKGDDASMSEALEMKAMWVDVLEGLRADEGLAQYWESNVCAEVQGLWARLYVSLGKQEEAERMHGAAAASFVSQGDTPRAMMELDEAITSQRRAGRHAEAEALFDASIALTSTDGEGSRIHWRHVEQRASLFTPRLAGVPFPFRKSTHYPGRQVPPLHPTAVSLEANFPAIQKEFVAMLLKINGHDQATTGSGGGGGGGGSNSNAGNESPPVPTVESEQYTLQGTADFDGMSGLDV
eukprot:gene15278-25907_t